MEEFLTALIGAAVVIIIIASLFGMGVSWEEGRVNRALNSGSLAIVTNITQKSGTTTTNFNYEIKKDK